MAMRNVNNWDFERITIVPHQIPWKYRGFIMARIGAKMANNNTLPKSYYFLRQIASQKYFFVKYRNFSKQKWRQFLKKKREMLNPPPKSRNLFAFFDIYFHKNACFLSKWLFKKWTYTMREFVFVDVFRHMLPTNELLTCSVSFFCLVHKKQK